MSHFDKNALYNVSSFIRYNAISYLNVLAYYSFKIFNHPSTLLLMKNMCTHIVINRTNFRNSKNFEPLSGRPPYTPSTTTLPLALV